MPDIRPSTSIQARLAAHASWARTADRGARTSAAREAARTALERRLIAEYDLDSASPDFQQRLEPHVARITNA